MTDWNRARLLSGAAGHPRVKALVCARAARGRLFAAV